MNRCGGRKSFLSIAVLVLLSFGSVLWAGPVDLDRVQAVTGNFLQAKAMRSGAGTAPSGLAAQAANAAAGLAPGGYREIRDDDGTLLAYVADLEPQGFVVLSADADMEPVVAYSFLSSFPGDQDKKHPLYRMVREDMRRRARALAERPELRSAAGGRRWDLWAAGQTGTSAGAFQQWPPEGSTATGGWLQTAWDQDPPYNQFCPLDTVDGGRSYVGCAATAVAQILNFHRSCNATFGPLDSYTMYSGMQMDADSALYDFPSFGKLNGLLQAVQATYRAGVDLNDVEVAALSFACGVAMQMDYSSEGSGASPYDSQEAVLKKFGFHSADMFGGLSAGTHLALQENIINRLPAMIGIRVPDGFGGHAVVCDGYNTDGEYHFNWGWGSGHPRRMMEMWYRVPRDVYAHGMVVTESVLNIRPKEPALQTDPATLSFYGVPGLESEPQILKIQNSVGDVLVSSISSPEGFVIARQDTFSDRIESFPMTRPRQTEPIAVKFSPQRAGGYYGALAIHYNDGNVRYVILQGWAFDGGTRIAAGDVSGTWTQANSPYFVSGAIQVPENGELAIEPGVKVFFTGPYGLTVGKNARLTAQGTATDPIEFTAWNRDIGWGGLRFLSSGNDDVLRYCWLTWAKKHGGFIPTQGSGAKAVAKADSHGGAIYCATSDPTIENCRLLNNLGDGGGAIFCGGSSPVISNTLIANNMSLGGTPRCGGIGSDGYGVVKLRNCTIVNNSPGGIFSASWDGLEATNTIVWGNDLYQVATKESTPTLTFCNVQGGYAGEGNLRVDPAFLQPSAGAGLEYDAAAANWGLRSRSPCLNAGTEIPDLPATDLTGAPRVASGVIDLGACENQSDLPLLTITPALTADAGCVLLAQSTTLRLDLTNTGKADVTVQSVSISESSPAFTLLTPLQDRVLAPGDSVAVEIAFGPTREAAYKGKLEVRSTASNAARVEVALTGAGVLGTVVPPGPVSGTWKKSDSPYIVTGDLMIPRTRTLTIEPGVTVKFAGRFGLTVGYRATLRAVGTEQERIVFTASDKSRGWFGIRFINAAADDMLQYCTLEYAKKPRTGGGGIPNLLGGAVLCYSSWEDDPGFPQICNPRIDSCRIVSCRAYSGGAIACYDGAEPTITNNTMIGNVADYYGGAIALYYSGGTIANNVMARNDALVGGGLANLESSPSITNNTIVANRPSALLLDSAYMDFLGRTIVARVVNNIIWKNEIHMSEDVKPEEFRIRFNTIQGGWAGEGNLDQDPLFADPDRDDYHLKSQAGRWDPQTKAWVLDGVTSPCLDAGDPASNFSKEPEPNGGRINMGAYGGTAQASKTPEIAVGP